MADEPRASGGSGGPGRLDEIVQSVTGAYGDLQRPRYDFMEPRYSLLIRHPFITDTIKRYFVKNDTDLNDHASLHLRALHAYGGMMVCLSFVPDWAMLFRLEGRGRAYTEAIDPAANSLIPAEREMLDLLRKHRFNVLTREEAAAPLDMKLFNTGRRDARVYHALISDEGVVPKVLGG